MVSLVQILESLTKDWVLVGSQAARVLVPGLGRLQEPAREAAAVPGRGLGWVKGLGQEQGLVPLESQAGVRGLLWLLLRRGAGACPAPGR